MLWNLLNNKAVLWTSTVFVLEKITVQNSNDSLLWEEHQYKVFFYFYYKQYVYQTDLDILYSCHQ